MKWSRSRFFYSLSIMTCCIIVVGYGTNGMDPAISVQSPTVIIDAATAAAIDASYFATSPQDTMTRVNLLSSGNSFHCSANGVTYSLAPGQGNVYLSTFNTLINSSSGKTSEVRCIDPLKEATDTTTHTSPGQLTPQPSPSETRIPENHGTQKKLQDNTLDKEDSHCYCYQKGIDDISTIKTTNNNYNPQINRSLLQMQQRQEGNTLEEQRQPSDMGKAIPLTGELPTHYPFPHEYNHILDDGSMYHHSELHSMR